MIGYQLVVLSVVAVVQLQASLVFPPDFKFGAATAAFQVEGAWNITDKTPSIWDELTHHQRDQVEGGADADVTCDSYHQWRRDLEMADELGLDFYRFSISWPRLCPNGFCNKISESGARYYSNLIDGLLTRGIEPMVTLYHWDLPKRFQDYGGWANPLIVDWFASYAREVFKLYANRVKTWITINELALVCDGVYSEFMAPILDDPQYGAYLCTKNTLLAHAKAWRIYDEEFRMLYHGNVSLANYLAWYEPLSPADQDLTELVLQLSAGRYSHAIFSKEGGWPPALEKLIADKSKKEGYTRSRLPAFTKEEVELVRGTYDFYALNYYTSRQVRPAQPGEALGPFPLGGAVELGAALVIDPAWKDSSLLWFKQNPEGLRRLLVWLKQQYGDIKFLITENGFPTSGHALKDDERVQFIKEHLTQVLLAIKDGVNVKAYTAWSLMDNFEWRNGYSGKFGLYEVNFTDPERTRTPRASAHFYSTVTATHALELPEQPKETVHTAWICFGVIVTALVVAFASYAYFKGRNKGSKMVYDGVPLDEAAVKT